MGGYQSFPNRPGAADSIGKLASILLPPLAGKSFLDVGCNEGFFCGYASFEASSKVVGIDQDESALRMARERFPYCDFRHGDWENLSEALKPEEKFDVILMASALHYSRDQVSVVNSLMERLNPDGTLVLEIGVVEDPDSVDALAQSPGWHQVRRSIDSRIFPDWKGVDTIISPYAYRHCGKSVMQIGDPLPRHVFHLKKLKPAAILMTGAPASGKSTLARSLGKGMKVIKGDVLLCQIAAAPDSYGQFGILVSDLNPQRIDLAMNSLCRNGGLELFAQLVTQKAEGKDFIYDGYIPHEYVEHFEILLTSQGFRVCKLETPKPAMSPNELSKFSRIEARKYQMFLSAIEFARKMHKQR